MHAQIYNNTDKKLLHAQRRYYTALSILVVLVVAALGIAIGLLYLQNERLADLAKSNKANSSLLVECTTPPNLRHPPVDVDPGRASSDCYERSQAATGKVVQNIKTISVAAAACGAAHPGDVEATEKCVTDTLAHK